MIYWRGILSLVILAAFIMPAIFSMSAKANDILFDSLQWRARVLVLTGEENDPLVIEQKLILRDNFEGLRERSIAVIRFDGDNIYEMDDLSSFNFHGRYDMDADLQGYYEDEMNSDNSIYSLVLFGKDGQRKEVWIDREEPVAMSEVFTVIDAMPMRQREMNGK
ncbi:MAG: DUF4174 domain-containing protein [Alphaproteobacteria bacterium]